MFVTEKDLVYPTAAVAAAALGAIFDIRSRRIPNRLTFPALALGLALHIAFDGWHGLLSASGAAVIAGSLFFVFFLAGGMGGGDVKLITAVAALEGMANTVDLLVFTALLGGVMAIVLALRHNQLRNTVSHLHTLAVHHTHQGLTPHPELNIRNDHTLRLPYGVAIAAGSLLTACAVGVTR